MAEAICTTGPVVEIPPDLPICDIPELLEVESIDAQFPEYPDVGPPPYCMCLPECTSTEIEGEDVTKCVGPPSASDPQEEAKWKTEVGGDDPFFRLYMVQTNDSCCDPELEFQMELNTPCTPFDCPVEIEEDDEYGETSLEITRVTKSYEEWYAEQVAELPAGADPESEIDPGDYDPADRCKLEFKLTIPPRPSLGVVMKHSGPGITYLNQCDAPSSQEGIKLTAEWNWDNALKSRILEITTHIDLGIPLIGKLSYNDGTTDTTVPLPPDSDAGNRVLGPPE